MNLLKLSGPVKRKPFGKQRDADKPQGLWNLVLT